MFHASLGGLDESRYVHSAHLALEEDLVAMSRAEIAAHSSLAVLCSGSGLVRPRRCGNAGLVHCPRLMLVGYPCEVAFFLPAYERQRHETASAGELVLTSLF